MESLKLSYNDRQFLRQLNIDPEVKDLVQSEEHCAGSRCTTILISATEAKQIIAEYGELNFETYTAYKIKH